MRNRNPATIKVEMDSLKAETQGLLDDLKGGRISDEKYAAKRLDKAYHEHRVLELELGEAQAIAKAVAKYAGVRRRRLG